MSYCWPYSQQLSSPHRDVCVTGDSLASLSTWAGDRAGTWYGWLHTASGGVDSVVHLRDTPSGQVVKCLPLNEGVAQMQFIATPPALLG